MIKIKDMAEYNILFAKKKQDEKNKERCKICGGLMKSVISFDNNENGEYESVCEDNCWGKR